MQSMVEGVLRAQEETYGRARELRRQMTLPEVLLWQALRKRQLARFRFRRQHPIGPYILDFYCPAARLAVEVDGREHEIADQLRHDARRDAWLARRGVRVMRVPATGVLRDDELEGVLIAIEAALAAPSGARRAPPPPRGGGGTSPPTHSSAATHAAKARGGPPSACYSRDQSRSPGG